ncbi:MAG: precorrin-8X methylmutase [Fervidobacterium sp.]|nr:precorrin-8X methylmutase [Fervidobacterium sp.]
MKVVLSYLNSPAEIELKSFSIIKSKVNRLDLSDEEKEILLRIIHTTADFQFQELFYISKNFLDYWYEMILSAKKENKKISVYVDTEMIRAGVNKNKLRLVGINLFCPVNYDSVKKIAEKTQLTRAIVGIDWTVKNRKSTRVFVIGNSPTALFRLCEHLQKNVIDNVVVIGVPVGFVGAKESKLFLQKLNVPKILIKGEKGGSTIAVAILNSLLNLSIRKLGFNENPK